jgi:dipeptidase E
MKLLLTSAGLTNDFIAKALSTLADRPLDDLCVIYITTAANTADEDKRWVIDKLNQFVKYNFKLIDILDVAAVQKEVWQERLRKADVICFGGGDEQYLAKVFEDIEMKEFLLSILETKIYMGISAGSMAAGQFLPKEVLRAVYPEELFEERVVPPMSLYNFTFIPHLNSEWFMRVRKEVLDNLTDRLQTDARAADDQTAIIINNGAIEIVGEGDTWVYTKEG